MRQKLTIWLFLGAVLIIPICVFATVKWYGRHFEALPVLGPDHHRVGDFRFPDQDGDSITRKQWENKVVVANFFFTHCPSICPKMMYQLKRIQAYGSKEVLIASFSVDPERDSVGQLKAYSERLGIGGRNWFLLTGEKKALYRFARKDLMIAATDGDGGPDDFIHSDNFVLIDRQGRIRGFYKGTDEDEVNKLIKDIDKLEEEGFKP